MLKRITWTIFHTAVMLIAIGTAVWLTITGHTLYVGGLLLAMGGILGAVLFAFRLAEGYEPGRLSIWAGPIRPRGVAAALRGTGELRRAA